MQETPLSLKRRLEAMTNDYSHLEALYRARPGSELVLDPYGSSCSPLPELTLSASVIVPAFNSRTSLEQCLIALEQSSFNRKYPEQLEVIVVDDGSSDGSWELLEQLRLALRLKALRLDHCGPSLARNAGLAYASGDVVICCDSDMILTPFSIEELVKRHQVLENVVLIGFRANVRASVRQLQADVLARNLPALLPPFLRDSRMDEMVGGWHIHICVATNHLKDLGHNRRFFLPIGAWADLPTMIWGALFSLRRSDFLALGGFSEQFQGWGHEDVLLGAQAIALGNYVIPVYSAAGFHLNHADRLPDKWASSARNYHVMRRFLHTPFTPDSTRKTCPAPKALRAFFLKENLPRFR